MTKSDTKMLMTHFKRIDKAAEQGDSRASIWWIERKCSEFSNGKWIDPDALLVAEYPDIDLNSEKDILSKKCWMSSAVILQRHYPDEFAPKKRLQS